MNLTPFTALIRRRAAACLLVLVALGQLAAAAHALDHSLADQAERCATCVHLDQGSQVPASDASAVVTITASASASAVSAVSIPPEHPAHFDARAPPLSLNR